MANEKFLNQTGLAYYHNRAKTQFENKIEKVIVNGRDANILDKTVYIGTPAFHINSTEVEINESGAGYLKFANDTNGVRLEAILDDGSGTGVIDKVLASKDYVDTNAGAINKIKVNGTEQAITNKEVDLAVPKVSATTDGEDNLYEIDITDAEDKGIYFRRSSWGLTYHFTDSPAVEVELMSATKASELYLQDTEIQAMIDASIGGLAQAMVYKGSVATVAELPATGNKAGDVYDVQENGVNYAWDGTKWDPLGAYVDTSLLWAKSELEPITTAEIDALFA